MYGIYDSILIGKSLLFVFSGTQLEVYQLKKDFILKLNGSVTVTVKLLNIFSFDSVIDKVYYKYYTL